LTANPGVGKSAAAARVVRPSSWLWIPYIWLFFTSTRALSTWLSGHAEGAGQVDYSGSAADSVLMTLLMLIGLFILNMRREQAKRILARNKWVVALFVVMVVSILWSNFPAITFRRSARSIGTLVMILVVLTERSPQEALRVLLQRLYLVQIPFSIIAIKYFRAVGVIYGWDGVEEQWIGLSTDKNSLGQVAMCSGVFWIWQLFRDWTRKDQKRDWKRIGLDVMMLILTLWLLRGSKNSHSSTAILGFLVCTALLIALQFIKNTSAQTKRIILAMAIGATLLAPFAFLAFQSFNESPAQAVLEATGRNMTLTDRTLLWTDVINNAKKHPLLGVGYGAFWVGTIGYEMYPLPNWSAKTPWWRPEQGHNGFIDAYIDLGLVGVALLLIITGIGFADAWLNLQNDFQYGSLRMVLLLSIVMDNITETSVLKGTHAFWFLFLLLAVKVPPAIRRARPKPAPFVKTEEPEAEAAELLSDSFESVKRSPARDRNHAGIPLTMSFATRPVLP
jgi:exopolysaccharide production protein ExoQ